MFNLDACICPFCIQPTTRLTKFVWSCNKQDHIFRLFFEDNFIYYMEFSIDSFWIEISYPNNYTLFRENYFDATGSGSRSRGISILQLDNIVNFDFSNIEKVRSKIKTIINFS